MATTKPNPAIRSPWRRRAVWLGLGLIGLLLALFWQPLNGYARTGAAYGARVACSCHFVGGRSLSDCRKDFEPGMEPVVLTVDEQARMVTARFPLLATETATYRPGPGCQLQRWPG